MKRFAGPALLFVISVCFCWRLVLTKEYTWLESPDLAYQVLPWLQLQAGEWRQGHVPLWDPYLWMGQPLIGQGQPGVMNPLNWILFAAPLRHGWIRQSAMHWYYVLLHFLPALFLYLLCRDVQISIWASIVGACVFAFGGFIANNDWPQMLSGAIWIPLVILFLLRTIRGVRPMRSAALSGMFLGLSWLSGHHQIPIFVTLVWVGLWIYFTFASGKFDRKIAQAAALSLLIMVLVAAVQTFPAYEYGRLAKRWAGVEEPLEWNQAVPYIVHEQYSLKPELLLGTVIPGVFGPAQAFVGGIAFALAILGLWALRSRTAVQLAAAISFFGMLLAIGGFTFLHGVLYSVVPLVEKARTPATAIVLFNFGIAVLCAFGAEAYRSGDHVREVRRIAYGLIAFGTVAFLIPSALLIVNAPVSNDRIIATALFCCVAGGTMLWTRETRPRGVLIILSLLVFCELSLTFQMLMPSRYDKPRNPYLAPMAQFSDVVDYLRSRPQPIRVQVDSTAVPFNFGDWWGIEQMGGYLASLTTNTGALEYASPRVQQLLAVNYYVGKEPLRPDQELLFTGASGLKVFSNPGAFDRVRLVHNVVRLKQRSDLAKYIAYDKNDLLRKAPLGSDAPQLEHCAGDEDINLIKHSSGHEVMIVNAACRGMVVIAETSYPGWHANVDGVPARIYEPYGLLRGVVVERGSHRVELRYRPASVVWGGLCTIAGLLIVCILHAAGRRSNPHLTRVAHMPHTGGS